MQAGGGNRVYILEVSRGRVAVSRRARTGSRARGAHARQRRSTQVRPRCQPPAPGSVCCRRRPPSPPRADLREAQRRTARPPPETPQRPVSADASRTRLVISWIPCISLLRLGVPIGRTRHKRRRRHAYGGGTLLIVGSTALPVNAYSVSLRADIALTKSGSTGSPQTEHPHPFVVSVPTSAGRTQRRQVRDEEPLIPSPPLEEKVRMTGSCPARAGPGTLSLRLGSGQALSPLRQGQGSRKLGPA